MNYRYFCTLTTGEPVTGQVVAHSDTAAEVAATFEIVEGQYSGSIRTLKVRPIIEPYDWSGLIDVFKGLAFVTLVFLALYAAFWMANK